MNRYLFILLSRNLVKGRAFGGLHHSEGDKKRKLSVRIDSQQESNHDNYKLQRDYTVQRTPQITFLIAVFLCHEKI